MKKLLGDKERIYHIRDAVTNINSFVSTLDEDTYLSKLMEQSAVERQLEIIGEAVANLSVELKEKYPSIEWYKIKSFRNFIAHEYFGVSSKQIWTVIKRDLPLLKVNLEYIIKDQKW